MFQKRVDNTLIHTHLLFRLPHHRLGTGYPHFVSERTPRSPAPNDLFSVTLAGWCISFKFLRFYASLGESCFCVSVKSWHQMILNASIVPFIYATLPTDLVITKSSFNKYFNSGPYFWQRCNYVNNSLISPFIYLTLLPSDGLRQRRLCLNRNIKTLLCEFQGYTAPRHILSPFY